MPTTKKAVGIVAGVVAATGLGIVAVNAANDPTESVAGIELGPSALQDSGSTAPTAGDAGVSTTIDEAPAPPGTDSTQTRQVLALEELTGTLQRDDEADDTDDFSVGGVEVDFGPEGWLIAAGAIEDFDQDGSVEDFGTELDGLVGSDVTLLVRYEHDDNDDADAYVINDLAYRDTAGGAPPWQASDGAQTLTREQLVESALGAVDNAARVDDIDLDDDGSWDVDVVDSTGREYDVLIAEDGEILDVRLDG